MAVCLTVQLIVPFQAAVASGAPGSANASVTYEVTNGYSSDWTGSNGDSSSPAISADGRYVAFASRASNLTGAETAGSEPLAHFQIYVHDRRTGSTELISRSVGGGAMPANGNSSAVSISADGQYIAFESEATNLVAGDLNERADVFVWDRAKAAMKRISVSETGTETEAGGTRPSLSGDGRYVLFRSDDADLDLSVPEGGVPTDGAPHYRYEMDTGRIDRMWQPFFGFMEEASLSGNGRYAVFIGDSSLYRYDFNLSLTELLQKSEPDQANSYSYDSLASSSDGSFIAYREIEWIDHQYASASIKLIDLANGKTVRRIGPASGYNEKVAISPNGRYVSFTARTLDYPQLAPAYVLPDDFDIYIWDRISDSLSFITNDSTRSRAADPSISDTGTAAIDDYENIKVSYSASGTIGWSSGAQLAFESSGGAAALIWPEPEAGQVQSFHIYKVNKGGFRTFAGYAEGTSRSFPLTGEKPLPTDRFEVYAVNNAYDASAIPLSGQFQLPDTEAPYWESGNAGITISHITAQSARLDWQAANDNSGGLLSYTVWRLADQTRTALTSTSANYAILTGLKPETTYTIVLTASDGAGQGQGNVSVDSAPLTFQTLAENAETGQLTAGFADGRVTLQWSPSLRAADVEAYRIMRAATGEAQVQIGTAGSLVTSYTDTSVSPWLAYTYQIKGYDVRGELVYQTAPTDVFAGTLAAPTIQFAAPVLQDGQASIGGTVGLATYALAGHSVQAIIRYDAWFDAGGKKRAYPHQTQDTVSLTENGDQPGVYTGSWSIPAGAAYIDSVQAAVAGAGGSVFGTIVQVGIQTAASLEVSFRLAHLDARFRAQLEQALIDSKADIVIQPEGQAAVFLPFTVFDAVYRFERLPSGGLATISAGPYFSAQSIRLQPGLTSSAVFSDVRSNPTLSVSVTDTLGRPVPDVEVRYMDDEGDERFRGRTDASGIAQTSRLSLGNGTAAISVTGTRFVPQPPKPVSISITPTSVSFVVQELDSVTLSGKVADPFDVPVEGVTVGVSQLVNGEYVLATGTSGSDGRYSLQAYRGQAEVALYGGKQEQQLKFPQTPTLDLSGDTVRYDPVVERYEEGFVFLKLFYKKVDGTVKESVPLEEIGLRSLNLTLRDASGTSPVYEYPIRTWGVAGSEIEVCVNGYENQDPVCERLHTDRDNSASVELTIEEAARLEARFMDNGALYLADQLQLRLERWDETTRQWAFFKWRSIGNPLRLSLPEGKFRYEVFNGGGVLSAVGELEARKSDLLQLGDIPLLQNGRFAGKPGNGLTASATGVLPGETVSLRGAYRNGSEGSVSDARLMIEAPAGATLVASSIQVSGPGTIAVEEGRAVIGLGSIEPNQEGTVAYQLKIDETYALPQIEAKLRLAWNGGEEVIGRKAIPASLVSLEVPGTVHSDRVRLSGRAPGGSRVSLFDGDDPIGQTMAYPGGYWSTEVRLADRGKPSRHNLRVEAETSGAKLTSSSYPVLYSPDDVRLVELVMKQFNGKEVIIQPENGVARFPFVVNPYAATSFAAYFSDPERIESAHIRFAGDEPVRMERDESGVFRADIVPGYEAGDVYVEYTAKQETSVRQEGRDWKAELPPHLRDFDQSVEQLPADPSSGSVGGALFEMGDYRIRSETYMLADDGYQMTEEEAAAVADNRAPGVFGPQLDWSISDTTLTIRLSYYEEVENRQSARGISGNSLGEVSVLAITKLFNKKIHQVRLDLKDREKLKKMRDKAEEMKETIEEGQDVIDTLRSNFDSAVDFADRMDRLTAIARLAASCPPTNELWSKYIFKAIDDIAALSAITTVLSVADFLNPIPFDIAGLDPIGDAISLIEVKAMDDRIDRLDSAVKSSMKFKCGDDGSPDGGSGSVTGGSLGGSDGSDSGTGGGSGSGMKGGKAASPVYIYDPSGYIYEAVADNRIEGATVTVQQLQEGRWVPWEAEWFGQTNPQRSDAEGKYGWDVPFGTWKVVVDKDGYLAAESGELVVPPQHFDVNLPIVSLEPPAVQSVQAWTTSDGRGEVIVTFTKYIEAAPLHSGTLTAVRSGVPLTGTVMPVDVKTGVSPDRKELARSIVFQSDTALRVGEEVAVYVDSSSIQSYSGIRMTGDAQETAIVALKDENGPEMLTATLAVGGKEIRFVYNEPVDLSAPGSVERIALGGTRALPLALAANSSDPTGRSVKLFLSQAIAAGDAVFLSMPAGQVSDTAGNGSSAITNRTVRNELLSGNARLSALNVYLDGVLAPVSFDSSKASYLIHAEIGKMVTISAAAQPGAVIRIADQRYAGAPVIVKAEEPTNEVAVIVTSPDGKRKGYYNITINRVPATHNGSPRTPGSGAGGAAGGINVKRETLENGVLSAEYSYTASALSEALTDGRARLTMNEAADIHTALIPVHALNELLKQGGASLLANTPEAALDIPLAALNLEAVMEKLGASAFLRLKIAKLAGEEAARMLKTAKSADGQYQHANLLYAFELQAENGRAVVPMKDFGGVLITGALLWTKDMERALDSKLAGVYMWNEPQAAWTWLPSQMNDEQRRLQFKTASFGQYAPMSFKAQFTDVAGHWAEEEIHVLAARQVIQGTGQGRFEPSRPVTRAEFASLLVRATAAKPAPALRTNTRYMDVGDSDWYYESVSLATELGIVVGSGGGMFRPNDSMTREEMAIMLARALPVAGVADADSEADAAELLQLFADRDRIHDWAEQGVARTIEFGLLTGKGNGMLAPDEQATRAEAAIVLQRFLKLAPDF